MTPATVTDLGHGGAGRGLSERLVSGSLWGLVGKLVGMLSALAVNVLLARLLTMEGMASYAVLFSLVNVASLLAMLGLPQALVRRIAESRETGSPGQARTLVAVATWCVMLAGAAIAALCTVGGSIPGVAATLRLSQHHIPVPAVIIWIMLLAWQGILSAIFRGFGDIGRSVLFGGILQCLINVALLLYLWLTAGKATLVQVVICFATSALLSAAAGGLQLKKKLRQLPDEPDTGFPGLAADSLSLLVVSLVTFAMDQADLWIVSAFCRPDQVASYSVALRLSQTIPFFLVINNAVVSPLIAEMRVGGRLAELEEVLRRIAGLAFIPALLLALLYCLSGAPLLGLLFGPQYRAAASLLVPLAIGQLVNVWSGPCGLTLLMTGSQRWVTGVTLFVGTLSLTGSLLFVGRFGTEAVACASAAGLIVQSILKLALVREKVGVWTHLRLRYPFPAGGGAS